MVPLSFPLKIKGVNILKSLEWHPAHSGNLMLAVYFQGIPLSIMGTVEHLKYMGGHKQAQ